MVRFAPSLSRNEHCRMLFVPQQRGLTAHAPHKRPHAFDRSSQPLFPSIPSSRRSSLSSTRASGRCTRRLRPLSGQVGAVPNLPQIGTARDSIQLTVDAYGLLSLTNQLDRAGCRSHHSPQSARPSNTLPTLSSPRTHPQPRRSTWVMT